MFLENKDLPAYGRAFAWAIAGVTGAFAVSLLWLSVCFGWSLLK